MSKFEGIAASIELSGIPGLVGKGGRLTGSAGGRMMPVVTSFPARSIGSHVMTAAAGVSGRDVGLRPILKPVS
jgi:hypothetical protein